MTKTYNSFKDFFQNEQIELQKEILQSKYIDNNTYNSRLFLWYFDKLDLDEFIEYFRIFKNDSNHQDSKQILNGNLMRKMNSMLIEGYNPVECMLYASKLINKKLLNDQELQELLADRIKDIYIKQMTETSKVLENILNIWTWLPQVQIVITAIGNIGDNQELLDNIIRNYSEDSNLKRKVMYALLKNKTTNNLERSLKIIMNLQENEEDKFIGRIFSKEFIDFGYEAYKTIEKYYDNPGVSKNGTRLMKNILLKDSNSFINNSSDGVFFSKLAYKSIKDDYAYKDFLNLCQEKYNSDAFYYSRYSRIAICDFLNKAINDSALTIDLKNTAITSISVLGTKGYKQALSIIDQYELENGKSYTTLLSKLLLKDTYSINEFIEILCSKSDYELSEFYKILRSTNIVNFEEPLKIIQVELEHKFEELLEISSLIKLETLTENMQLFWNKKLYGLISINLLKILQQNLLLHANGNIILPNNIVISLIEILVHRWNAEVENVIFSLYKKSSEEKIKQICYKKLRERKIEAPQ